MYYQICQMIRNSFLLTLLFSQGAISTSTTSTVNDCKELTTSTQCQCLYSSDGYEIQCPARVVNLKIKIEVDHRLSRLILTCNHFDVEEYELSPEINTGYVNWLHIEDCPLSSKSISHLLTHLDLNKLQLLKFENHISISNITREHFSGLNHLKRLVLNITDLSLIRENLFMDLPNLESLIIHSTKISLTRNTFDDLLNLKWLHLEVENLQQLPVGIFRNQRMLQGLKIDHTQLRNMSKNFFEDVNSLSELSLSCNGIENFQSDVFSLLTNLTYMDLSNNNFRELPSGIFAHNKQLRTVIMTNSKSLTVLPSGLFSNLPNLYSAHITCDVGNINDDVELHLNHENIVRINCGLGDIPYNLFANSSKITKISLAQNKLVTLADDLFKHQFLLTYLDLSHNRLQSVSKKLFSNTNQLTVLKLSHNYLTEISRDLFSNLYRLEEIYLNNNRIKTIDSKSFLHHNKLRYIYMENNRLNMSNAFEHLQELEILNLRNNTLCHIFRGSQKMINLTELDLSHNFITELNCSDILYLSIKKLSINLNSNRISKINMTYDLLPKVSNKKLFLSVQLNNNPLDCDCNLLPFLLYVSGVRNGMPLLKFEISKLVCEKPNYMKHLNLLQIEPKDLLCPIFESPYCPLGCECWERTYDSILLVNCSSTNLTAVPALSRVQPLGLAGIELHVENNELKELPIVSTSGYADIIRIYAAGNNLNQIDVINLPAHLSYLDISRNKLRGLNKNVIHFFKGNNSLKEIALSENPWNCDCESKPLMQFVGRSYKMIVDIDKIYCVSPKNSNMIEYFNTNDECKYKLIDRLTSMLVILGIALLIAITVALCYKYQTEIKVLMYKYKICIWMVIEEEELDKTYDAFVFYSSKDEQFVSGRLVPELEDGPMRFKLCIHICDFMLNDIIPDQIINAMADSKRIIVVLSENLIQSDWTRMEFRIAYQAGLEERRTKVIAIFYGNIGNFNSLDLVLQANLKRTTYLKWSNPLFWDRLRYAMPHSIRSNEVEPNEISTAQNTVEADG